MIKVYSLIDNYAKDRLSTEFKVKVVPKSPFVPQFKPIWEPILATQRLKVGDDLEYEPVFNVVKYDYIYTLKVRLNRISLFGTYDEESNLLNIDGDKVTIQDVGTYQVSFVAEFFNGIEFFRKDAVLIIQIWTPIDPNITPPDGNSDYPDWNNEP